MSAAVDAIDRRGVNVQLTVRAADSYDTGGDAVPGAEVTSTIKAVIQPLRGNVLMDVPEGVRTEGMWLLWSHSAVTLDDVITYEGRSFRVAFIWPRVEGAFTRAALGLQA